MTWLELAIAQHNHRLTVAMAWSAPLVIDWLDIELMKRERCN